METLGNEFVMHDGKQNLDEANDMQKKSVSREFILERVGNDLGNAVFSCKDDQVKEYARKAATICRRRFKPQDVIAISLLDEEEDGDAGLAFTNEAIYHWEEGDNFVFAIFYSDIAEVDYDSNGVRVKLFGNDNVGSSMAKNELYNALDAVTGGILRRGVSNAISSKVIPCVCYDLNLDEDEEQAYIRAMYNFVADIVDEVKYVRPYES